MARHTEHNTSRIYPVAEAFRANCLLRVGSLLFDAASIGRLDVLDRIHKAFVATPDEGDRSDALGGSPWRQLGELRQIIGDVVPRCFMGYEHMKSGLDARVVVQRSEG
jgi:hypothetical protein